MSGRKSPESESSSSSDQSQSSEIRLRTGSSSDSTLSKERWISFPRTFSFVIMGTLGTLWPIMQSLWHVKESLQCTGVKLELASRDVLGRRPEWKPMLRILEANFGTGIEVKKRLLSMNFEEVSMSRTYCDGWIVILYQWNSKGQADPCKRNTYGSRATCPPPNGTLT